MAVRPMHIASICAGGAGLDLGLHLALGSARTVVYVERDIPAAAVLAARMEDGVLAAAPIWDDVATFDGRPWRGLVDIFAAGVPCQDFSLAGKRAGTAGDKWIWPDVARIIRDAEPRFVFMENVPPFVVGGLDAVLRDLAILGFDAEWDLFSAAAVGAPHFRKRFFLLAHARRGRDDTHEPLAFGWGEGAASASAGRSALADTGGSGRGASERDVLTGRGQPDAPWSCAALADTERIGRREAPEQPEPVRAALARAICPGECLADATSERCRETGGLRCDEQAERAAAGSPFPPGPDEWDDWRALLNCDPSLEPALCGDADGLASRLERLHILGNGVVPLVAARAFLVLAQRLAEE